MRLTGNGCGQPSHENLSTLHFRLHHLRPFIPSVLCRILGPSVFVIAGFCIQGLRHNPGPKYQQVLTWSRWCQGQWQYHSCSLFLPSLLAVVAIVLNFFQFSSAHELVNQLIVREHLCSSWILIQKKTMVRAHTETEVQVNRAACPPLKPQVDASAVAALDLRVGVIVSSQLAAKCFFAD